MVKVKIPWQGDTPLHTPRGVYHFKDGIGEVDEETYRRLRAIYGDKIEVVDEDQDTKTTTNTGGHTESQASGQVRGQKSRRKVSDDGA
ncbi:MAG: hypothetical protein KNN13_09770 [Hydrogenobacter thermophilus]|uniref:hypothetical protein n=1 Tax=Hydrogenobacter thermophilus TaxID=940 RepID=UPI001C756BEA|nr:hypothetical protein [Hydrogenobacter thermophilus]QWK19742.1 MAG: hypothetical protein KNN13_09770 [Hydrogenobacter thermophilus]